MLTNDTLLLINDLTSFKAFQENLSNTCLTEDSIVILTSADYGACGDHKTQALFDDRACRWGCKAIRHNPLTQTTSSIHTDDSQVVLIDSLNHLVSNYTLSTNSDPNSKASNLYNLIDRVLDPIQSESPTTLIISCIPEYLESCKTLDARVFTKYLELANEYIQDRGFSTKYIIGGQTR